MREMKVYGWQGWRIEAPGNGHHATREIIAARSKAEAARLAGKRSPREMWCLCETGNKNEIAVAMMWPGMIFWSPLDGYGHERVWHRVAQ